MNQDAAALLDSGLAHRSTVVRKAIAYGAQPLKRIVASGDSSRPPILVNSIPKSGTHLLMQVARSLPDARYFGSFVSEVSSLTLKSASQARTNRAIMKFVDGEVVGSHLHYRSGNVEALGERGVLNFFIFRDPRAILLSSERYLYDQVYWNKAARYLKSIENPEDRFRLLIRGIPSDAEDWTLPPMVDRLAPYVGWANSGECFSVSFENIVGNPSREIERLLGYYESKVGVGLNAAARTTVLDSVRPEKSHTFRSGQPNQWRTALSGSVVREVEEQCGEVIAALGYT